MSPDCLDGHVQAAPVAAGNGADQGLGAEPNNHQQEALDVGALQQKFKLVMTTPEPFSEEQVAAILRLGQMLKRAGLQREARQLFGKLSLTSNPTAMNQVGAYLRTGSAGVEKNQVLAMAFFASAAKAGNTGAMVNLGLCHLENKENDDALKWLTKAAERGSSKGQVHLGRMLAYGFGVEVDREMAIDLFLSAAAKEDYQFSNAYYNMGRVYHIQGKLEEAKNSYLVAANNQHERAAAFLRQLV